jgi:hypothetical protein
MVGEAAVDMAEAGDSGAGMLPALGTGARAVIGAGTLAVVGIAVVIGVTPAMAGVVVEDGAI